MIQIIDTTGINIHDPEIVKGLGTDLRRMERLFGKRPAEAYRVTVGNGVEYPRLVFDIQEGKLRKGGICSGW